MNRIQIVASAFILLQASSCFASSSTVDQQYIPTNPTINSNVADQIDSSQVFTVGIRGELTAIDVLMYRDDGVTEPLFIDVRGTVADKPTDSDSGPNILASGMVKASDIPLGPNPYNFIHFELTPSVPVEVGDKLAFVLQTNDPRIVGYSWMGDQGRYSGGNHYFRATFDGNIWRLLTQSSGFRTYVTAVPEPHLIPILGSAVFTLGLVGRRWRRETCRAF